MDPILEFFVLPAGSSLIPLPIMLLSVLIAFVGGMLLSWIYIYTHSGLSYSRSFVNSLVVIPVIVSLVMMVMVDSIITAFGLMAVFAIVRFRNILRDTLDTAHILCVIVVGMAAGTQKFMLAILAALVMALIMLFTWWTAFGVRHRYDYIINFQWARSLAEFQPVQTVLERYCQHIYCASRRSIGAEGANLSYRLLLRDPDRAEALLDEIKTLNGVSHLSGIKAHDEEEV